MPEALTAGEDGLDWGVAVSFVRPTPIGRMLAVAVLLAAGFAVSGGMSQGRPVAAQAVDDTGLGPDYTLPPWADASNWSDASSYDTIQFADVDGDGGLELLGRSAAGLEVWRFTAYEHTPDGGYWLPLGTDSDFGNDAGWDAPEYYETIQTADVDGDGASELLARSSAGLEVRSWDSATGQWTLLGTDAGFDDASGWDEPQYYETIQTAPILETSQAEQLIVRGADGINTYRWNTSTNAWDTLAWASPVWSDDAGWDDASSYTTIQTADMTGSGAFDLLGRGPDGLEVHRWDAGSSTWDLLASDDGFSDANGWVQPQYYETIQTGDVLGTSATQLLARDSDGLMTKAWDDGAWVDLGTDTGFSDVSGWGAPQYYETIQTGDVTGDGQAEVLARDADGMVTKEWSLEGGWQTLAAGDPALTDAAGWDDAERYRTIQVGPGPGAPVIARDVVGLRTWLFDEGSQSYQRADDVGYPPMSAAQQRGYADVNARLGVADLRATFDTTDTGDLNDYLTAVDTMSSPDAKNLTRAEWKALQSELGNELNWAIRSIDHYQTLRSVLDHATLADDLTLSSIVTSIDANPGSGHVIDAAVGEMAAAITDAVVEAALTTAAGPAGAIAGGLVATAWGIGVDELFSSDVSGTISQLETTLADDFQDALSGMQDGLSAITTNYGLLYPVGSVLDAAPITTTQQAQMRAAHVHEWTVFAYRTAAHAERDGHAPTWGVAGCGDTSSYANGCSDYQWSTPAERYYQLHDGGVLWIIQFKTFGADNLSDSLYDTLFDDVSTACRSEFTSDCSLGIDKETIMFDWDLPDCWTPARTGCPSF